MLLDDNIVLVNETREELDSESEQWKHTLEFEGFRLTRSKTEYLKWGFSCEKGGSAEVTIVGVVIPRVEKFRYLCSIIQEKGDIDKDINQLIRVG